MTTTYVNVVHKPLLGGKLSPGLPSWQRSVSERIHPGIPGSPWFFWLKWNAISSPMPPPIMMQTNGTQNHGRSGVGVHDSLGLCTGKQDE